MIKSPWVWIHEKLTTGIHGVGAGTVGIKDKDTKILDADADTGFEVEQSADEDKIHGKVAGVEAFLLSAVGIQTLAKQSRMRAKATANQIVPNANVKILLDTEDYDNQNECNTTVKTGAADGDVLSHLQDDGNAQFAASDVGAMVWNSGDNTYATVTVFNDTGDVTLSADIFPVGNENYKLFHSRWTAKEAGDYLILAMAFVNPTVADKYYSQRLYKNGAAANSFASLQASYAHYLGVVHGDILELAVDDYIELWYYQDGGANVTVVGSEAGAVWMAIHKLS